MIVTFPGRFGDLLWALPTVRAISEAVQEPLDLIVCGEFRSICPLLELQPYIKSAQAIDEWGLHPPSEWQPPGVLGREDYRLIMHLGYRGWPDRPLAQYVYAQAQQHYGSWFTLPPLELERPWIRMPDTAPLGLSCVAAFTEEWFELKVGLCHILQIPNVAIPGSRWTQLEQGRVHFAANWATAAAILDRATVIVADLSALHVLAVALGRSVLIVEPSQARATTDIFWPLGRDGQVKLVRGNDGQATWDAPTVQDAIRAERYYGG